MNDQSKSNAQIKPELDEQRKKLKKLSKSKSNILLPQKDNKEIKGPIKSSTENKEAKKIKKLPYKSEITLHLLLKNFRE